MLSQFCYVEDLLAKTSTIRCGAGDLVGLSKQQFVDRLTWIKNLMRFNVVNWHDRKNYERVSHTLEMLKLDDSNGSIRKQPYCILLTGYPGCGKSNYALRLASACLKAKYGKAHAHDIVTLNETDEYQSEYRTSHKVVIFDDLGAENPNQNVKNPWRKVIDFVNNIRKTSLNPNVEMKGNVYIEPDLVIITTNLGETFDTSAYCQAPSAVYRRLKQILFLERDFSSARKVTLNHNPVPNHFEKARVFDFRGCCWEVTDCLPRSVLEREIVEEFLRFDAEQQHFVNETNSILDVVETKSLFSCFYDDIIRPSMPKVISLPAYVEEQLPWYHRWYRNSCQKEDMPICMSNSEQLDIAYKRAITTKLQKKEEKDDSSVEQLPINMIWHYLYKKSKDTLQVNDNESIVRWMNLDLERSALGQLEPKDLMAMVQYTIAMRARKRSFRCLGVEYSLNGFKPDVVLKSGDYTIIVECKNTKTTMGKRQVENYLRSLQEDGNPSLGILFSQREIKFYSLEPLPTALLGNAKELIFDVLDELRRRSDAFGTNHFSNIDRCGAVGPVNVIDELSTNSPKGNS